ncbi:MAG: 2-polyprenyl-6-methoxyphenol hydroxylase-like FAD-dependent oxidoreductase [Sulfitobacter sp.]|jgi:2-polyprenyl-6-methoxyphenol hydroxylase-like FAD-dependent oxidoreductase
MVQQIETQVLIIGAGPCGLMLANELGQRGIDAIVVDQKASVAQAPQANATQARTMEHYRRLGLAEEIRAQGLPADYPTDVAYFTTLAGHEIGRHKMPSSGRAGAFVRENAHIWNAAEMPHRIPQSLVEQTLWRHATGHENIAVRFDMQVTGFEDDGQGVSARIKHTKTGETTMIRASYMFAADGAQSPTRRSLGIRHGGGDAAERDFMGGRMLSVYVDAPTFYDELDVPKAWMYWAFNRRRRGIIAATDGLRTFSFGTQLRPGEDGETMSLKEAGALFTQAVGRDIPHTVKGIANWTAGRALVADKFQSGRVMMGGDAVHIFTPTGGMGYNTAIEDAVNAGWKLAAVLKGQAAPALLDSYEAERRPVAFRNTAFALRFADSVGLFAPSPAIEDTSAAGDFARKRAGSYLAEHGRNEFTIPGFTLGARYDTSPVIWPEQSLTPPDAPSVYVPSAKPGGRAPHLWLEDGSSLFDNFGFEWTLLCLDSQAAASLTAFVDAAERRHLPLKVLDLKDNGIAADFYQAAYALIRPDQVVAWRGALSDTNADAVLDLVTARVEEKIIENA